MSKIEKIIISIATASTFCAAVMLGICIFSSTQAPFAVLSILEEKKPSYETLKSHTVYIIGCASKESFGLSRPLNTYREVNNDDKVCWGGSAVIVKETKKDTYILTNNHVAGKGIKDPMLFVSDGNARIRAEIVKNHPYVDLAVIKISKHLKGKTAIKKIDNIEIQDKAYVVGNPLSVKNVYSEGVMAGYEDLSMLFQIPCIFGSSGSGIFDKNGSLVALVYALEVYPGFLGMPMARITHTLAVDGISIKIFLKKLGLYND